MPRQQNWSCYLGGKHEGCFVLAIIIPKRVHTDEGKKPGGNVWALSTFPTWDNNPNPKQGRSRRQLFHPFGDSSVRHNKQRGSALKFPHTPFQSSDIKLKHAQNHAISFPVFRVRSVMQNSVFLLSVYFCWSGLL